MNLLYLIDPNSIHDLKWIKSFTSNDYRAFFICRKHHYNKTIINKIEEQYGITFLGAIADFSIVRFFGNFIYALRIKKWIKKHQIQIFHIQYAEPNALWSVFRPYFKIPIIITCRGTDVLKTIPSHFIIKNIINIFIAHAYKRAFCNADWVTVTSIKQTKSIQWFSQISDKKITLIRTGVDLNLLNKNTNSPINEHLVKPYILFPRYIKPIYNHEFTIEALKLLPQKIKEKYFLVFIGKNDDDLIYQSKLIDLLNEDKNLNYIFLPKQTQEEIHSLIAKSSLIVMNPLSDGSPVSGMEAIALGKPLIIGPLDYDEDIFNKETVIKLNNWDIKELVEKIELFLNKPNRFTKIDQDIIHAISSDKNMYILNNIYLTLDAAKK